MIHGISSNIFIEDREQPKASKGKQMKMRLIKHENNEYGFSVDHKTE